MTDPIEQKAREAWEHDIAERGIHSLRDWSPFLRGYRAAAEEEKQKREASYLAGYRIAAEDRQYLVAERDQLKAEVERFRDTFDEDVERQGDYAKVLAERDEALEALRELSAEVNKIGAHISWAALVLANLEAKQVLSTREEQPESPAVTTSPSGVRQTTPTEILKSEKGRDAVEKTAGLDTWRGVRG